ncbi:MAG TPA: hemerythrin domain-containing protein [Thermoanaerobaculia bacterium]
MNSEDELLAVQKGLRSRFDDFRRALDRREDDACRLALADFHAHLSRWTAAEERILLPALARASFPGRDPERELRLEYVQIRELTRYLLTQIGDRAPLADVLGLVENLERRIAAHESEMENVYYPAAAPLLTPDEWRSLRDSAPPP